MASCDNPRHQMCDDPAWFYDLHGYDPREEQRQREQAQVDEEEYILAVCRGGGHPYHGDDHPDAPDGMGGRCYCGWRRYPTGGPS